MSGVSEATGAHAPMSRAAIARRTLASVMSLGMATVLVDAFRSGGSGVIGWMWIAVVVLIGAPVVAAGAIWTRFLALQLLARAYWWVQLLFTALFSATAGSDRRVVALAVGSAAALLSAGRIGLDESGGGRFRPVAFRGTLMLALVLAMADAGTFSWIGLMQTIDSGKVRFILLAPPMIAAVIGLLRLRTWGLLVSVACNVLVAVLVGGRVFEVTDDVRGLFVGMAIVQLLIPLPMWVAIICRRPPPPDRWQTAKMIASTIVIVALASLTVVTALLHGGRYIVR